jgi:hypothetical protein
MSLKIKKSGGAEPDEFELTVAQELSNLEVIIIIILININFY